MKSTILYTLLVLLIISCSSDDGNENDTNSLANFRSQLCDEVTGLTASSWDAAHGLPSGLTAIPTIANPAGRFTHSAYPPLSFTLPSGFTAQQIGNGINEVGVNVFSDDNQILYRYIPSIAVSGAVQINDVVAQEINNMLSFYSINQTPIVLCRESSVQPGTLNLLTESRLISYGNRTAQVLISVTQSPIAGASFLSVRLQTAPTTIYDNQIIETFFPIDWQLLVVDDSVRDTDLDGTPDNQDNFPLDPNRQ